MPVSESTTPRSILIVGAGVIGCSLARELASRGQDVTLVDASELGTGATAASYAWVNAYGKEPQSYAELNALGIRAHERWSADRERRWFHQTGNIRVVHDARRMADLEREVASLRALGYLAELLTPDHIAEMEPSLAPQNVAGGAYFPSEGWVDTGLMCSTLVTEAVHFGARFMPYHRVTELTQDGVVLSGADGVSRRLEPDVTVLAAGNGIRPLAQGMGINFPTLPTALEDPHDPGGAEHPTVGMTCTTTPIAGAPKHMVNGDDVSMRPSPNGGVMITDHPTASRWDSANPGLWDVPQALLDRARTLCPALAPAEISTATIGHRVLPADGITIAGWLDSGHRYYAVATHSGVTLAPHLAETVAEELLTGTRHASLTDFALERFGDLMTAIAP